MKVPEGSDIQVPGRHGSMHFMKNTHNGGFASRGFADY
jgi:hypothetical protein